MNALCLSPVNLGFILYFYYFLLLFHSISFIIFRIGVELESLQTGKGVSSIGKRGVERGQSNTGPQEETKKTHSHSQSDLQSECIIGLILKLNVWRKNPLENEIMQPSPHALMNNVTHLYQF